jgi:hypothetical protein
MMGMVENRCHASGKSFVDASQLPNVNILRCEQAINGKLPVTADVFDKRGVAS